MAKVTKKTKEEDSDSEVIFEEDVDIREPKQYKVLLHNDDYTPMNFVVEILRRFFFKSSQEATLIMLKVHQEGVGICGIYSHEMAETKIMNVHKESEKFGYPLKSSMEET